MSASPPETDVSDTSANRQRGLRTSRPRETLCNPLGLQLQLANLILSRLRRTTFQRWLHFLASHRTAPVPCRLAYWERPLELTLLVAAGDARSSGRQGSHRALSRHDRICQGPCFPTRKWAPSRFRFPAKAPFTFTLRSRIRNLLHDGSASDRDLYPSDTNGRTEHYEECHFRRRAYGYL